jgi:iron(III) transport system ATP-binding protein
MVAPAKLLRNGLGRISRMPQQRRNGADPVDDNSGGAALALECCSLCKRFGDVEVVHDLDLRVSAGQVLVLLGPSGCGKTTALRLIAGFEQPDGGTISLGGHIVSGPGTEVAPEKRRVGMVFQEGALFPHLNVERNISFGLSRKDGQSGRVRDVLDLVGLSHLRHRMPHELSGGQQQRVALGRALAPQPELLLLDEPFANLDPKLRDQVRQDVLEIVRASHSTTVFVTHDQEEALLVGDIIAVMNQGRLEQTGSPQEMFTSPSSRFVAQFIGMVDFLPARRVNGRLMTEVGSVEWRTHWGSWSEQQEGGSQDSELEVMVRPDCLDCYPSDKGQGIIVDREFRGAFYIYRVGFPSGNTVRCLLPHTLEYPVGEAVGVALRHGHMLRPFPKGESPNY